MGLRTWVYQTLTNDSDLNALVNQRIFAKRSMKSMMEDHPYLVYKMGNDTDEGLTEDGSVTPHRHFFQIFIHDYSDEKSGDYLQIDEIESKLKALLQGQSSAENDILNIEYLETSQDLNDETLGTVYRYIRFVATLWR